MSGVWEVRFEPGLGSWDLGVRSCVLRLEFWGEGGFVCRVSCVVCTPFRVADQLNVLYDG